MPRIIEFNDKATRILARELAEYILDGKIVIIPTDTCYGMAADATNFQAVKKVFKIKRRPLSKPISIFLDDIATIPKYALIDGIASQLINLFPDRITIIFRAKKTNVVQDLIVKNMTIGIRIPPFSFPRLIVRSLGRPITATSANIHGKKPIYDISKLFCLEGVDIIVDYGILDAVNVSTVIDITSDNKIRILREGAISVNELRKRIDMLLDNYQLIITQ